jgi:putative exporter of polyketide antibiotics
MDNKLPIESHYFFWIVIASILAVVFVVFLTICRFKGKEELLIDAIRESTILRIFTVLTVVWAASALAILRVFTEGIAALFGVIVGYVLGTIKNDKKVNNT